MMRDVQPRHRWPARALALMTAAVMASAAALPGCGADTSAGAASQTATDAATGAAAGDACFFCADGAIAQDVGGGASAGAADSAGSSAEIKVCTESCVDNGKPYDACLAYCEGVAAKGGGKGDGKGEGKADAGGSDTAE